MIRFPTRLEIIFFIGIIFNMLIIGCVCSVILAVYRRKRWAMMSKTYDNEGNFQSKTLKYQKNQISQKVVRASIIIIIIIFVSYFFNIPLFLFDISQLKDINYRSVFEEKENVIAFFDFIRKNNYINRGVY